MVDPLPTSGNPFRNGFGLAQTIALQSVAAVLMLGSQTSLTGLPVMARRMLTSSGKMAVRMARERAISVGERGILGSF